LTKECSCFEELAKEATNLLNDSYECDQNYDNTRWSIKELVHYAQDAVIMTWMLYPKKFTTCKTITLKKGKVQKLPEGCVKLTNVLGVNGDEAAASSIAATTDDRLSDLFHNECTEPTSSDDYSVKSWSIEETSDNIFYVTPPVPCDGEVELDVICSETPDVRNKDYCPEAWMHNLIIEWILYRAYSSEDESTYSQENSQAHLNHFYTMIGNFQRAEMELMDRTMRGSSNASTASN
jgi:hypothetical protein